MLAGTIHLLTRFSLSRTRIFTRWSLQYNIMIGTIVFFYTHQYINTILDSWDRETKAINGTIQDILTALLNRIYCGKRSKYPK